MAVAPRQEEPPGLKLYTGDLLTDEYVAKMLEMGYGGVVVWNRSVGYKNKKDLKTYKSFDDLIVDPARNIHYNRVSLFFLPKWTDEEGRVLPNDSDFFLLMAPAGEYDLTRLIIDIQDGSSSLRIFQKITIEKNQIKYLGDVVSLLKQGLFGNVMAGRTWFLNYPEEFRPYFIEKYPKSSAFLTFGPAHQDPDDGPAKRSLDELIF